MNSMASQRDMLHNLGIWAGLWYSANIPLPWQEPHWPLLISPIRRLRALSGKLQRASCLCDPSDSFKRTAYVCINLHMLCINLWHTYSRQRSCRCTVPKISVISHNMQCKCLLENHAILQPSSPSQPKLGSPHHQKMTLVIVRRRGSQGQSWRSKIKKLNQQPVSLLLLFYYYETWRLEEKIQGSLLHSKPLAKYQDNICSSFIHSTNIRWACTEYPILFTVLLELEGRIWWDLYWYRTHNPKRQKATTDHMNLSSFFH